MNNLLYEDALYVAKSAIESALPETAVVRALEAFRPEGKLYLVAVGKAAWRMARAALNCLSVSICAGIVLTKYHHIEGELPGIRCYEAGHPVPDENSYLGTQAILDMTANLTEKDTVLFLLSGGGSALFEKPLVSAEEMQDITQQLLACGADITEINTLRKRLSAVKGGRFAAWCAPAQVYSLVLSDVLGDRLDMIASGPAVPDESTCAHALNIAARYQISLSAQAQKLLMEETPKELPNAHSCIIGSVAILCDAAAQACRNRGYTPIILTDCLDCEAREAGRFLASILRSHAKMGKKLAFLAGGETVVHLRGSGLGGRNQELALSAAVGLQNLPRAAIISVGSDGTDGPTDAAGGYADGDTMDALKQSGIDIHAALKNNDAYHALRAINQLIITGPTGTNVNDIAIGLLAP